LSETPSNNNSPFSENESFSKSVNQSHSYTHPDVTGGFLGKVKTIGLMVFWPVLIPLTPIIMLVDLLGAKTVAIGVLSPIVFMAAWFGFHSLLANVAGFLFHRDDENSDVAKVVDTSESSSSAAATPSSLATPSK
jgi:hypothetical protein